ncbi:MMPL family transporter [Streptomyces sp. NRRL F-5123]|uniref:MMPL family transporter n=1 Tax=Streptomyces sp. NRRL F-5123 TaxID=1463856 RepID=UPI0004E23403|nr:MMPL family transporter [Streptomyces sp. NRRL F-5123]
MMRKLAALPSGRVGKWVVIAIWVVLLVPAMMLAGKLSDAEQNDNSAWLPGNAESTAVVDRVEKLMPADAVPAIVIYDRAGGVTDADMAKAKADAQAFQHIHNVEGPVQEPVKSDDGKAIQTVVQVHKDKSGWDGLGKVVDSMSAIGDKNPDGLGFHVAGPVGYGADSIKAFGGSGVLTTITALVVVAILLLTYRSPWLPLLPLITVGVALVAAEGLIYLLAQHAGLVINKQTSFILVVLIFGAGTDYALLLISRYREELTREEDRHKAMAEALYRSGPAIVASAATVSISLLLLMLARLNSTAGMGPACAISVAVGLLAMITLMPALLVACGRWVFWPKKPAFGAEAVHKDGVWTRVGASISVRPRLVWTGTVVVLLALSAGIFGLKASGLANKDQFTNKPQMAVGEQLRAEHFPAGNGDPVYIAADSAAAGRVKEAVGAVPGVAQVADPIAKGDQAVVLAQLKDEASSDAALATLDRIRTAVHHLDGADAQVGGSTAIMADTEDAATRDDKVVIPLVLAVVLLILCALLRSVVAPLLLMATVLLSFGATLGVSSLVFNHLFHFAGADASFPLLAFVFLVALGIDYNIFLVTRIREDAGRLGTRKAALSALSTTGGVITSAGVVLAGTFGAMGSLPMVFAAELGFTVAFGVLLDTIVVRSVLVTALTLDTGRWMWWPSALFHRRDDTQPAEGDVGPVPSLSGR